MLEFFLSFLLTIYSVYAIAVPEVTTVKEVGVIENNLPDISITLSPIPTLGDSKPKNISSNSEEKTDSYNTQSEKPVGFVANIATEKSPVLVPCSENPNLCITPTLSPTPEPKPTEAITPVPTIDPPKPTPSLCPQKNIYCLDVVCPLGNDATSNCGCPCVPPSAY